MTTYVPLNKIQQVVVRTPMQANTSFQEIFQLQENPLKRLNYFQQFQSGIGLMPIKKKQINISQNYWLSATHSVFIPKI